MKRITRFLLTVAAVGAILASGTAAFAARPTKYDKTGRLPLITEPGESAAALIFVKEPKDQDFGKVTWADGGVSGKAVRLNGKDEYFRMDYKSLYYGEFGISLWINWQGESVSEPQRILSIRGAKRDTQHLTLSPSEEVDGKNRLKLDLAYGDSDWPIIDTALRVNEWHHLAVTADGQYLRLYVDGKETGTRLTMMSLVQMRIQQMYLGRGWTKAGDGYLNALLDDVFLYNRALSADEIAALYQDSKPAPTTTTVTTTAPAESDPQEQPKPLPAVPPLVFLVVGIAAAVIILFFVIVNLCGKKDPDGKNREKPRNSP